MYISRSNSETKQDSYMPHGFSWSLMAPKNLLPNSYMSISLI